MARSTLRLPFSGDRLREWRERAGLTQQDLADACGLSRFQISRWETGQAKPGPRHLNPLVCGLAQALRAVHGKHGFKLNDLLD